MNTILPLALLAVLAATATVSVTGCGSSSSEDGTDSAAGATTTEAFSWHGISGPLAVIADVGDDTLHASVRQGDCEFTIVGGIGAHAISPDAEIWTGDGLVGHATVDVGAEHTVAFQTSDLPAGCDSVFNRSALRAGVTLVTTQAMNADVVGFRTILVDRAYFRDGVDLTQPGNSYVIKGQTVQIFTENGQEQPGYVLARFTAPGASTSTVGHLQASDLSPASASSEGR